MKVFVVMGNDFPESVHASEAGANAEIKKQKENDKDCHGQVRRIHWRHYEFEVKS